MVRPIPPEPRSTDEVIAGSSQVTRDEVDSIADPPSNSNRSPNDYVSASPIEEALRQRLGPGFELRTSTLNAAAEEGAALYRRFLADEFRRRNLPEPAEFLTRESTYNTLPEPSSGDLIRAGQQLRQLSEEFSHSPLRHWVEEQSLRVPLDGLDFDSFSQLLYGLFQEGGVTWERVVVLFYFCADLAVRAVREKLPQQFYNIVDWSFRFIAGDRMLRWVAENGGWVRVLQTSVDNAYKMARIGFFIMGILAFTAYIWKSR